MNPYLTIALLVICIAAVAALYSSVGHGGASGYIAAMALFSLDPTVFKPTALALNILVAAVASISYARAGHFNLRLFWPFAATSIPFSFLGGYLHLPSHLYKPLVGILLLICACRLFFHRTDTTTPTGHPPRIAALAIGALLGLLSGLSGVGGGIFLSPILLFLRWGSVREVSGVAALFILVNSVAGLAGHFSSIHTIPYFAPLLAIAALLGGFVGSFAGSRRLPVAGITRILAVVLIVAGCKLMFI